MRFGCTNLTYTYPGTERPVLKNLNFSMDTPGFNAIFGPSGVGKTSLARLALGTSHHDKFFFHGISTALYSYNQERLPGWSATGRHLDKVCPEGKEALKQELIRIFELEPLLGARFSQLSMGQQNRMNLIRYLIQDFDLLILDESLANVDEALRETIILAVKEIFSDRLFLYISHNLTEVAKFCKDILILGHRGSLQIHGQNLCKGDVPDQSGLDRTMLEIMNAV